GVRGDRAAPAESPGYGRTAPARTLGAGALARLPARGARLERARVCHLLRGALAHDGWTHRAGERPPPPADASPAAELSRRGSDAGSRRDPGGRGRERPATFDAEERLPRLHATPPDRGRGA